MTEASDDELRDRGDELIGELAARRAGDEDLSWLDELYRAADTGAVKPPWDRGGPEAQVAEWLGSRDGGGGSALVVGCGPGHEAELAAARGYRVTAFDLSPAAIAQARQRWPDSAVDYVEADLLDPPVQWRGAFDLVIECQTVQCMPLALHDAGLDALASFLAPGGALVLVAAGRPDGAQTDGPPWPLTPIETDRAVSGLTVTERRQIVDNRPGRHFRWRIEAYRPV